MSAKSLDQVLCIKVDTPQAFFTSICCRSDGCYLVINGGNNRIYMYNEGGRLLLSNFGNRLFNRRLSEPFLITELPNRRLAIFDKATNQIIKLSWHEDHIATFDVGLQTHSLTTNLYGHMVLAHQNSRNEKSVSIRDSNNGNILHSIPIAQNQKSLRGSPFYAAYSLQTLAIILDKSSSTLSVHTLDGAKTLTLGKHGFLLGSLNIPTSLCLDSKHQIIVADSKNDRIVRYKCDSSKQCEILIPDVSGPLFVAFDHSDHLLVVTAKALLIYDYDIKTPTAPRPVLVDGI